MPATTTIDNIGEKSIDVVTSGYEEHRMYWQSPQAAHEHKYKYSSIGIKKYRKVILGFMAEFGTKALF